MASNTPESTSLHKSERKSFDGHDKLHSENPSLDKVFQKTYLEPIKSKSNALSQPAPEPSKFSFNKDADRRPSAWLSLKRHVRKVSEKTDEKVKSEFHKAAMEAMKAAPPTKKGSSEASSVASSDSSEDSSPQKPVKKAEERRPSKWSPPKDVRKVSQRTEEKMKSEYHKAAMEAMKAASGNVKAPTKKGSSEASSVESSDSSDDSSAHKSVKKAAERRPSKWPPLKDVRKVSQRTDLKMKSEFHKAAMEAMKAASGNVKAPTKKGSSEASSVASSDSDDSSPKKPVKKLEERRPSKWPPLKDVRKVSQKTDLKMKSEFHKAAMEAMKTVSGNVKLPPRKESEEDSSDESSHSSEKKPIKKPDERRPSRWLPLKEHVANESKKLRDTEQDKREFHKAAMEAMKAASGNMKPVAKKESSGTSSSESSEDEGSVSKPIKKAEERRPSQWPTLKNHVTRAKSSEDKQMKQEFHKAAMDAMMKSRGATETKSVEPLPKRKESSSSSEEDEDSLLHYKKAGAKAVPSTKSKKPASSSSESENHKRLRVKKKPTTPQKQRKPLSRGVKFPIRQNQSKTKNFKKEESSSESSSDEGVTEPSKSSKRSRTLKKVSSNSGKSKLLLEEGSAPTKGQVNAEIKRLKKLPVAKRNVELARLAERKKIEDDKQVGGEKKENIIQKVIRSIQNFFSGKRSRSSIGGLSQNSQKSETSEGFEVIGDDIEGRLGSANSSSSSGESDDAGESKNRTYGKSRLNNRSRFPQPSTARKKAKARFDRINPQGRSRAELLNYESMGTFASGSHQSNRQHGMNYLNYNDASLPPAYSIYHNNNFNNPSAQSSHLTFGTGRDAVVAQTIQSMLESQGGIDATTSTIVTIHEVTEELPPPQPSCAKPRCNPKPKPVYILDDCFPICPTLECFPHKCQPPSSLCRPKLRPKSICKPICPRPRRKCRVSICPPLTPICETPCEPSGDVCYAEDSSTGDCAGRPKGRRGWPKPRICDVCCASISGYDPAHYINVIPESQWEDIIEQYKCQNNICGDDCEDTPLIFTERDCSEDLCYYDCDDDEYYCDPPPVVCRKPKVRCRRTICEPPICRPKPRPPCPPSNYTQVECDENFCYYYEEERPKCIKPCRPRYVKPCYASRPKSVTIPWNYGGRPISARPCNYVCRPKSIRPCKYVCRPKCVKPCKIICPPKPKCRPLCKRKKSICQIMEERERFCHRNYCGQTTQNRRNDCLDLHYYHRKHHEIDELEDMCGLTPEPRFTPDPTYPKSPCQVGQARRILPIPRQIRPSCGARKCRNLPQNRRCLPACPRLVTCRKKCKNPNPCPRSKPRCVRVVPKSKKHVVCHVEDKAPCVQQILCNFEPSPSHCDEQPKLVCRDIEKPQEQQLICGEQSQNINADYLRYTMKNYGYFNEPIVNHCQIETNNVTKEPNKKNEDELCCLFQRSLSMFPKLKFPPKDYNNNNIPQLPPWRRENGLLNRDPSNHRFLPLSNLLTSNGSENDGKLCLRIPEKIQHKTTIKIAMSPDTYTYHDTQRGQLRPVLAQLREIANSFNHGRTMFM